MAATLEIDELNQLGLLTHGIVNLNTGNADGPNLAVTPDVAIRAGQNAYVKYHKLHFTDLGTASSVQNLRIWVTGVFAAGEAIQTNLWTTDGGYQRVTFQTPTPITYAANPILTADPGTANLGIGSSLTGSLTGPGSSDIWKWQYQTALNTPSGAVPTKQFMFAWDET